MEGIVWLSLAKLIQILYIKDINTDNNHTKEHTSLCLGKLAPLPQPLPGTKPP